VRDAVEFGRGVGERRATLARALRIPALGQGTRDGRGENSKQGVALNETEAYDWEIRNADRNGLSAKDKATIADRRATKYDRLTRDNKARADAGDYPLPCLIRI